MWVQVQKLKPYITMYKPEFEPRMNIHMALQHNNYKLLLETNPSSDSLKISDDMSSMYQTTIIYLGAHGEGQGEKSSNKHCISGFWRKRYREEEKSLPYYSTPRKENGRSCDDSALGNWSHPQKPRPQKSDTKDPIHVKRLRLRQRRWTVFHRAERRKLLMGGSPPHT